MIGLLCYYLRSGKGQSPQSQLILCRSSSPRSKIINLVKAREAAEAPAGGTGTHQDGSAGDDGRARQCTSCTASAPNQQALQQPFCSASPYERDLALGVKSALLGITLLLNTVTGHESFVAAENTKKIRRKRETERWAPRYFPKEQHLHPADSGLLLVTGH